MKRILFFLLMASLLLTSVVNAKVQYTKGTMPQNPVISARPIKDYRVHNVGNVWSATSNFGNYGEPNATLPSGEWPAGSGIYYVWEGRFWIGALVGGQMLCSHADYGNYEFEPSEGSTFYLGPGKSIQDSYVTFDDLEAVGGHTPIGLKIQQRGLAWSMPDYYEFLAYEYNVINVSGGVLNGVVIGWIFDNDVASGPGGDPDQANIDDLVDFDGYCPNETNTYKYDFVENYDYDGDGELGGYDEYGWPYAKADFRAGVALNPNYDPSLAVPDGVWDEFQVYVDPNGPVIYRQVPPIAPLTTFTGDTLHGWLLSRDMSYIYDSDYPNSAQNDVGERGALTEPANEGFVGGRLIYTDHLPFYEASDDTMRRVYAHQWWNWNSDPGSDVEKYQYLTGTHAFSLGMKFLPHPFDYQAGAPVFDYRYLESTGLFNGWADGDTIKAVYAYGVGMGPEGLRNAMDNAMYAYYSGSEWSNPANPSDFDADVHWLLPIPPAIPTLTYSPGDQEVQLVWDLSAETTIDAFLGTTDFEGYKVYRSKYSASAWELIFACDNRSNDPVYVVNTDGDTMNTAGAVDLPDIAGLPWSNSNGSTYNNHTFMDRGGFNSWGAYIEPPINGLRYFYTVVAYDPAKPDMGLGSIESAKSNYKKTANGAPDPIVPHFQPPSDPDDLSLVNVVPNPYKGTSLFEPRYEAQVMFTHLPPQCKISIFTLTGDLVMEIFHNDANYGDEIWNLISRNNQSVVSGLYLYVVETSKSKKIGKMLIIR